ncbi:TrbI/VirB10 family protein [Rhodovulum tesquicola]|uniref:Type IV secretion system protein VirB10 n=1 Tax=Rhodovulum steppense TaxID=540251 RepID=A0A4R1YWF0_9RHOB|nr:MULTISPECIES: TrbI/VirB10 family protein [Rhodovulum]MCO8145874.1 TrbI/VirB10 family protein [Rhodovulum tesquicola]TCM85490.1 type IV secretion system protein VirB10 [Rhodovulum steppense]
MKEATEDLAARLAALEGTNGKRMDRRRASPITAFLGVAGIAALGGVLWLALQPKPEGLLATAAPDEFQTLGTGFGDIAPLRLPEPEPLSAPEDAGPSAAELALMESLATLRAELEELRARPAEVPDSRAESAIAELTAQIAALQAASHEAQRSLERQLTERDRQLDQMRMDLELARLNPPEPVRMGPTEEELRLAELERRRLAEAEARAARVASPLIAWSGAAGGRADAQEQARLSADEAFVRTGARPAPTTRAEVIVNPSHTVVQGTMIQAVTETALDSTLPGAIRAIVSEDVHSFDGSRVLIPRGARLIGRYRSDVALAQARVMVAWDRIILPDNQTVEISAFGGDALGRTGTTGFVDTRFSQRFGSAALISLIGAVPTLAAGKIEDGAIAGAAREVSGDLRDAAQGTLRDYLAIRPVIHVDQGSRITVMVDRDLEIL